jgi:DNA-binding NtrC family response regulator
LKRSGQDGIATGSQTMHRMPTPGSIETIGSGGGRFPPGAIVLHTLNVEEAERALIRRALELTKNNRTKTAELLGISVRTLRNKLNGARGVGRNERW